MGHNHLIYGMEIALVMHSRGLLHYVPEATPADFARAPMEQGSRDSWDRMTRGEKPNLSDYMNAW